MNFDTKNYYMVLVRNANNLEDEVASQIYGNKRMAMIEAKRYMKNSSYNVEILHYTGTPDDQMRNFWGTITP